MRSSFSVVIACLFILSIVPIYSLLIGLEADQATWQSALGQSEPPGTTPPETITAPTPGTTGEITPVVETTERRSSIVLLNIEWLKSAELAGDAAVQPDSLTINNIPRDEDCCYIIHYTPGPVGKAGLAYESPDGFDLSRANRVVFFAKGEQGGENVRFLAAGKSANLVNGTTTATDIFTSTEFAGVSEPVVLDTNWTRYQIDVDGVDLSTIEFPFGFIVEQNQSQGDVAFSLRDVTYDAKIATEPLPLESTNTTNSLQASPALNSTEGNSTQSPDTPVDEALQGNTTQALQGNTTQALQGNTTQALQGNTTQALQGNTTQALQGNTTQALQGNTTQSPVFGNTNSTLSDTNTASSDVVDVTNGNNNNVDSDAANTTATGDTNSASNSTGILDSTYQNHVGADSSSPSSSSSAGEFMSPPFITKSTTIEGPDFSDNNTNNSISNNMENIGGLSSSEGSLVGANNASLDQIHPSAISTDNGTNDISSNSKSNDQLSSNVPEQQYTTGFNDMPNENPQLSIASEELKFPYAQYGNQSSLIEPSPQPNAANNGFDIQQRADDASTLGASQLDQSLADSGAAGAFTPILPTDTNTIPQLVPPSGSPTISGNPFDDSPPETVIVSANDSSAGIAIQSGSTTSNSSVTFVFEGFDDSGISGYSCSIENLEPFACSSPVIYDTNILQGIGLGSGSISDNPIEHLFQVSAIDNSGNVDPTPAAFTWMGINSVDAETLTPETLTPETLTPETLTPETLPPEYLTPDTIAPPQLPIDQQQQQQQQQQQPQITVPGPLIPNTIAPPQYQIQATSAPIDSNNSNNSNPKLRCQDL